MKTKQKKQTNILCSRCPESQTINQGNQILFTCPYQEGTRSVNDHCNLDQVFKDVQLGTKEHLAWTRYSLKCGDYELESNGCKATGDYCCINGCPRKNELGGNSHK